jgi:shikimate kinase
LTEIGNNKKHNIALIGFMGVGKTSIARLLATRLGFRYIGIDALIEEKAGKSITEIFLDCGEQEFREIETQIIKDIAAIEDAVIDCGGGVVLNRINITRLKKNAVVVYLSASNENIIDRVINSKIIRPLLNSSDPGASVQTLLRIREPLYEFAADVKIDTTGLSISETVDLLSKKLK